MTRLVVNLNAPELYDVEPASGELLTDGEFAVEFRNHGQPVHVHLRPDDALSRVTAVEGTNHYVEAESALVVEVPVAEGAAGTSGRLEIVTGYGKGSADVAVTVEEEDADRVEQRETGGTATSRQAGSGEQFSLPALGDLLPAGIAAIGPGAWSDGRTGRALERVADSRATLALVVLAVLAVVFAAVAAVAAPGEAVVAGIFVVLVGLAMAGYVLVQ